MWSYLCRTEPAELSSCDVLVGVEAGEMDERWLIRDAQERENGVAARLARALTAAGLLSHRSHPPAGTDRPSRGLKDMLRTA